MIGRHAHIFRCAYHCGVYFHSSLQFPPSAPRGARNVLHALGNRWGLSGSKRRQVAGRTFPAVGRALVARATGAAGSASPPMRVTVAPAEIRAPRRRHSVPGPACGGAMLTLLRVPRSAVSGLANGRAVLPFGARPYALFWQFVTQMSDFQRPVSAGPDHLNASFKSLANREPARAMRWSAI